MAGTINKITMRKTGPAKFEAVNAAGNVITAEGSPDIGGTGSGMRPMEILLVALASCSSLDVMHIMQKQRQPLDDLTVEVEGARADAVPAVYTDVKLVFTAAGPGVTQDKLQRAVDLSMEKYCSVTAMLQTTVKITAEARVASTLIPSSST